MFLFRSSPFWLSQGRRHVSDTTIKRINFVEIDAKYAKTREHIKKSVIEPQFKTKSLDQETLHNVPKVRNPHHSFPNESHINSKYQSRNPPVEHRDESTDHQRNSTKYYRFNKSSFRESAREHKKYTENDDQDLPPTTFESFKLLPELQAALKSNGLEIPTKVQSILLTKYFSTRNDLLFAARTGTGKSLGYLLTLLNERVIPIDGNCFEPRNLVIVPNGILALQIHRWALTLNCTSIKLLIPDVDAEQVDKIYSTPSPSHILIGTPEHLRISLAKGTLKANNLSTIVLDEADYLIKPLKLHATLAQRKNRVRHPVPALILMKELLNMCRIRPRLLITSATLNKLTRKDLEREKIIHKDALFFKDFQEEHITCPPTIKHFHRLVDAKDPIDLLFTLQNIHALHRGQAGIAFLPQDKSKQNFKNWLEGHKLDFSCAYLQDNSNPSPDILLIGSSNDARGVDLPNVRYVVILDPPETPTSYLHMAGRVGRVGQGCERELHAVYTILGQDSDLEIHTTRLNLIKLISTPF